MIQACDMSLVVDRDLNSAINICNIGPIKVVVYVLLYAGFACILINLPFLLLRSVLAECVFFLSINHKHRRILPPQGRSMGGMGCLDGLSRALWLKVCPDCIQREGCVQGEH